ncbi:MAG: D-Ala-D-Ala carboxypeptidase family metallohydrolase [Pseudomonadota bacterium]
MDQPLYFNNYQMFPLDLWRWPNFSPPEMACRGTGKLRINPHAMDMLQVLRDSLAKPIYITSAYRSPEHNAAVKGAKNSQHMSGIAFDCALSNHDPLVFEIKAREAGFTGIAYYPEDGFMHIDTGPERTWGAPLPSAGPNPSPAPTQTAEPEQTNNGGATGREQPPKLKNKRRR